MLDRHFIVAPSAHAGTHVHVSTTPASLGLSQQPGLVLAAVAKAALYFEPALDALLPASRSGGRNGASSSSSSSGGTDRGGNGPYWCQSNRASVAMKDLPGLAECFALLDRCCAVGGGGGGGNEYYHQYDYGDGSRGVEQVVRAMCLFPASSAYGRVHGYKADFIHGVYKWDFSGLLPDTGSGTLEYRQVSEVPSKFFFFFFRASGLGLGLGLWLCLPSTPLSP